MYPAIDLAAGEKERGTIETLLTTPANRFEIFIGKFGVVALGGFLSAIAALVGLFCTAKLVKEVPPEITEAIFAILELKSVLMLLSILLPLTMFFASVMLSISVFAKSFKEAQSTISPMMVVVILPAVMAFLPGMELNMTTAMIPIFNVSLAAKEIISGTIEIGPLLVTYASLIFIAGLGVVASVHFFKKESIILKG
jgi:sodium transport system permease protein